MNVTLVGATGQAGSRILDELLRRGHSVKAVVREESTLSARPQLEVVKADVNDVPAIADTSRGADALVSAYGPGPENPQKLVPAMANLIEAARQSGVPRFVFVGGAGTLEIQPGITLIQSGAMPSQWMPIAVAHEDALKLARDSGLNWTCFSPAGFFEPGERTGKFRLGKDRLIADDLGNSKISMEDYAIALVDELEHPKHERSRFTIGY